MPTYEALATKSIALLIPDFDFGGEEKRVVLFANHYAQVFRQVFVFAPAGASRPLLNARVRYVESKVRDYRSMRQLAAVVKQEKISCLQGHKRATLPYLFAFEKLLGVHAVFNFDNIYPTYNYLNRLISPRNIIYLSDIVKDFYAPLYQGYRNTTINMGGDFYQPALATERAGLRAARGWGQKLVILNLGRLSAQKNQRLLLAALRALPTDLDFVCVLAGSGPDEAALRELAAHYGLQAKIEFLGHITAPRELLCAADLLVQSSIFEGFPNVLIEAASVGLPVVATEVGSTATLVAGHGLLVPSGSAPALTTAIAAVHRDLSLYRQRADSLRQSAFLQQFHKQVMVDNYLAYYNALAVEAQGPIQSRVARSGTWARPLLF